jgi:hypothetical protein
MKKTTIIVTILMAYSIAAPSFAQQAAEPVDENIDVVSEGYRQSLQADGIISRQIDINDQILLLEREKDRADAITSLVDALGYDAKVTLTDGNILDLSTTKAGREARLAEIQREQQLINAQIALEKMKARAKVLEDPAVQDALRVAEETEIANELVARVGPNMTLETASGRVIDLSETTAGKQAEIDNLKTEAELIKAKAELEAQSNEIVRIQAEREQIAAEREQTEIGLELEKLKLERERAAKNEPTPVVQTPGKGSPQVEPRKETPEVQIPNISVGQIYGDGVNLRASLTIDENPVEVRVGDPIGTIGRIKAIERTFVLIGNDSSERKYFIY